MNYLMNMREGACLILFELIMVSLHKTEQIMVAVMLSNKTSLNDFLFKRVILFGVVGGSDNGN